MTQQVLPTLDGLPVEIKLVILKELPDLATLRDLTHAVPAYHHVYADAKREILNTIANRDFVRSGIDFLDPLTAIDAAQFEGVEVDDNLLVAKFFSTWRNALPNVNHDPRLSIPLSLAVFHLQRDFEPLIQYFIEQTYSKNPKLDIPLVHQPPSRSELRRIIRAFSRLEIYGKVFGRAMTKISGSHGYHDLRYPNIRERAIMFLLPLPKHEVEELQCAYRFAEHQWAMLLESLKSVLAEEHYQMGDWGDSHEECLEYFTAKMPAICHGLPSLGPRFLSDALRADEVTLLALVRPHLTSHNDGLAQLLWMVWHTPRRGPILEEAGHEPSVGWLWTRRSEKDFEFPHGPLLHDIGYAMWDQERLEAWNITQEDMLKWGWEGFT